MQKQLLALQLAFDIGEISEEDFEIQEEELLLKIQALEEEAEESGWKVQTPQYFSVNLSPSPSPARRGEVVSPLPL